MENLFLRVLTLSLTVSLVLLPLLALAPRLHHRYAGRTFYVLWLVLAVRLVLPLQPVLPEPAVTVELPPSQAVTVPAVVRPRAEAAVSDVPQSAGAWTAPDRVTVLAGGRSTVTAGFGRVSGTGSTSRTASTSHST